ncbi:MAG: hypothetical protein GY811_24465 [Myxococcales bacterium]|nr:hypothetical protein [Myxococcales bacterium]
MLSWFIRTSTRSPASHSFLLFFSEQFAQHMVLEVQGRGFVQVPFEVWKKRNKLLALYEIERQDNVTSEAMQMLGRRLGALYDCWSLIGFLLIYVVRVWDRNDLDDKKKLVCSEMVALFLRWCRIPLHAHIDRVVPRDLWRLAETHDEFFSLAYSSTRATRRLTRVKKMGRTLVTPKQAKRVPEPVTQPE